MDEEELRKQLGQLFVVGFNGHTVNDDIKTLIHPPYYIGGVVLFQRNVDSAEQLISLTRELQQIAKDAGHTRPLFIAIDQENGMVSRIQPPIGTQLPGAMALGATGSVDDALLVSWATGELLEEMGINMNYAPVCDVNSEPSNPVIGVRSPGDQGEYVGRFASAIARGLREKKIIPCVKHFPGHGDTAVDSHFGSPIITKSRESLDACELLPFRRTVAEHIEAVMTAHIAVPSLDESGLPASLSEKVMNLLRNELQYDGLVISDCLEMDAVRAKFGTQKGAVMALKAGTDIALICHTFEVQVGAFQEVLNACKDGTISIEQFGRSVSRVHKLKDQFLDWDSALRTRRASVVAAINRSSKALADEVYVRSITVVRDNAGLLPISPQARVLLVSPSETELVSGVIAGEEGPERRSSLHNILKSHTAEVNEWQFGAVSAIDDAAERLVTNADVVIYATRNARLIPSQKEIGLQLAKLAKYLVVVATCDPYDFIDSTEIKTLIATYEPTPEAFESAAKIMFGTERAKGSLPVLRTSTGIPIEQFDATRDMSQVVQLWHAQIPRYAVQAELLAALLNRPNCAHFVVRSDTKVVGFVATIVHPYGGSKYICAVLVDAAHQSRGVGTALLSHARKYLRTAAPDIHTISLGSNNPRFWPGVPLDISARAQTFFVHRGFCAAAGPTVRDYYLDLRTYEPPVGMMERAAATGVTFSPWRPEQYKECMEKQRENFGTNPAWVDGFERIAQANQFHQALVGVDNATQKQIAWALMLEPGSPFMDDLAFPSLVGEKTGLVGCVGVDKGFRRGGVGLALVVNALLDLKRRGMHYVFVDWVALENWYEKVGLKVWREYRNMTLNEVD